MTPYDSEHDLSMTRVLPEYNLGTTRVSPGYYPGNTLAQTTALTFLSNCFSLDDDSHITSLLCRSYPKLMLRDFITWRLRKLGISEAR